MIAGLSWRGKGLNSSNGHSHVPFGLVDGTGDDFQFYAEEIPAPDDSLTAYSGWAGAWRTGSNYVGVMAQDDFQTAPLGTPTNLNTGLGWDGTWVTGDNYLGQQAQDDNQTYEAGAIY